MTVVLNKIDPVVINNVHQQTAEGVVHTYEKTRVAKDGKREKGNQSSRNKKGKVDKLNSILKAAGVDISLRLDDDLVSLVDKDGNLICSYAEDEIDRLIEKIRDLSGVIIDTKR